MLSVCGCLGISFFGRELSSLHCGSSVVVGEEEKEYLVRNILNRTDRC